MTDAEAENAARVCAEGPLKADPGRPGTAHFPNRQRTIRGAGGQSVAVAGDGGAVNLVTAVKILVGGEEAILVVGEESESAVGEAPGEVGGEGGGFE